MVITTGEGTNEDIQTSPRNKDIAAYLRNGKILKHVAGVKVAEMSSGDSRLPQEQAKYVGYQDWGDRLELSRFPWSAANTPD